MTYRTSLAAGLIAGAALIAGAVTAEAKCTRLAFSVNDYGKDGPTKDAKDLLDKYVAKWATEQGITNYTMGKKDVTCELFLNFIVFDEHTCKAEANVCWPDTPPAKSGGAATAPAAKPAPAAAPSAPGRAKAAAVN